MSYDEYEYLPALIMAMADPSEEQWTIDGWRIARLGLVQGSADYGKIYDPLGPEATGWTVTYMMFVSIPLPVPSCRRWCSAVHRC
ncbi:hypothetical protein ACH4E7_22290 [Kitasatospora sp. NPDC018058]|uniref:hypothetical protein n=1 Tax=Kitasatospora sp. NPDC018058 TaxID=3364025 RepID=UPI0037C0A3EA